MSTILDAGLTAAGLIFRGLAQSLEPIRLWSNYNDNGAMGTVKLIEQSFPLLEQHKTDTALRAQYRDRSDSFSLSSVPLQYHFSKVFIRHHNTSASTSGPNPCTRLQHH